MTVRAILLNGPSSSGKSSLAQALAAALGDAAHRIVSIDDYLEMTADEPIWEDDVYEISPLMCAAVREALAAGENIIIDHVITSERIFRRTMEALADVPVLTVRVTCSREALIRREAARKNRCPGSAEASEDYLFPKIGYDLTVDTTGRSPAEVAGDILSHL